MKRHQSAGRIVDEHQQRACRSTLFEPQMIATFNLNQLSHTMASIAQLIYLAARLSVGVQNPASVINRRALSFPKVIP